MKKKFRKLKLNKKGFTLLECVVAIAIIGIMSSAMMSLFSQGMTFINKAQTLDASAGQASQILSTATTNSVSQSGGDNYFADGIPVKVQFTIVIGSDMKNLATKEYNFQAGVVINNKTQTKVVYYDISTEDLKELK